MPQAHVVVIGGGLHGTATSYELARAGLSVTLLERDELASGASGGIGLRGVRATDRDLRELPLMRHAYDIWPALRDELGDDPGFRRIGGLVLYEADTADDPLAMARINAMVAAQNAHGIPTELIGRDRLRQLEPGVSDLVAGAIYTPLDGVGDQTRATRTYAAAAQRHGAIIHEHTPVARIVTGAGRGGEVITSSGAVHHASQAIVVLANSYSPGLLSESFGLDLPVWRYNPQATPVRAKNGYTLRHLVNHVTRTFSAKTIGGNLVMLTGGRSGSWDAETDRGCPDPAVTAASVKDAPALFPDLADAEVVGMDASRADSVSIDEIPIIDRVPSALSVYFGVGWSGHGFAIAPAVARLLAQWVRTDVRPAELEPFELARLAAHPTAAPARSDVGA